MATRRKTTIQPADDHVCNQQQCLGSITARLDDQEKTDERIEKAVLGLVDQTIKERANTAAGFEKVHVELAKMSLTMEATKEATQQQIVNQTKMLEQLVRLSTHTESIQKEQTAFKKSIDHHIQESNAWKKDIESRLSKLEKFKYVWYILGVGLLAVLSGAAYLVSVLDFAMDYTSTKTEQVDTSKQ